MTYRSATRMAYHLDQTRTSLAVAMDHLHNAESSDVDPAVAGAVYGDMRTNLHLVDLYCLSLVASRGPDLDREEQEGSTA